MIGVPENLRRPPQLGISCYLLAGGTAAGGWLVPPFLGGLMVVDGTQVCGLVGDVQVRGLVQLEGCLIFGQLLLELARGPANLSVFTCETGVSSVVVEAG